MRKYIESLFQIFEVFHFETILQATAFHVLLAETSGIADYNLNAATWRVKFLKWP